MGTLLKRFRPARMIDCVQRITAQDVAGKEALLLDLDNTLTNYNGQEISEQVTEWLQQMRQAGLKICIVSNNHKERIRPVAENLQLPFVEKAGKPGKRGFLRAAHQLGVQAENCVVIGDQMMTDVHGGNAAGMYTILVRPIDPSKEYGGTYFNRLAEKILMRHMKLEWPGISRK